MTKKNQRQSAILLVDDEPIVREPVTVALRLQGFSVDVASNAADALHRMALRRYDLILLDIDMPEVSGIDLLRLIISNKRTRHIPVLMLTNAADLTVAKTALALGAKDYILKAGFSLQALIERIERLLNATDRTEKTTEQLPDDRRPANDQTPPATKSIQRKTAQSERASTTNHAEALRLVREHAAKRAFPGAIIEILGLISAAQGSLSELVAILGREPALSSRLLKAANAPAAGRAKPIASLDEAVQVLGTRTIRDLSLSLGLFDLASGHDVQRCLQHSLATALFMERFARDPTEAGAGYAIGLCHQLGNLAIRNSLAQPLAEIAEMVRGGTSRLEAERHILGAARSHFAIAAIEGMCLPAGIVNPILEMMDSMKTPKSGTYARRLQIATSYGSALLLACDPDEEVLPLTIDDLPDLGPTADGIIWRNVAEQALATAALAAGGSSPPALFTAHSSTCMYVRGADSMHNDPFGIALESLCKVVTRARFPVSTSEWVGAGALITVRGKNHDPSWLNALTKAVECRPTGATILVIANSDNLAGLPHEVIVLGGKPTLGALTAVILAAS